MLTVIYAPAQAVNLIPDGYVQECAAQLAARMRASAKPDQVFTTCQETVVAAIRLAVKRGDIHHAAIQFAFKDELIAIDAEGRLSTWPEGFCDASDRIVAGLIDWDDVPA